jgi:uncharacterized protein YjbI with pentapeptide repeats
MRDTITPEKLEQKITEHELYLSSHGEQGTKLFLGSVEITSEVVIEDRNLSGASIQASSLNILMRFCNFEGANIAHSTFNGSSFEMCNFTDASLSRNDFIKTKFIGGSFMGCNLKDNMIRNSTFRYFLLAKNNMDQNKIYENNFQGCIFRDNSGYGNVFTNNGFLRTTLNISFGIFTEWRDNYIDHECNINWSSRKMIVDVLKNTTDINIESFAYLFGNYNSALNTFKDHLSYDRVLEKLRSYPGFPGGEELL